MRSLVFALLGGALALSVTTSAAREHNHEHGSGAEQTPSVAQTYGTHPQNQKEDDPYVDLRRMSDGEACCHGTHCRPAAYKQTADGRHMMRLGPDQPWFEVPPEREALPTQEMKGLLTPTTWCSFSSWEPASTENTRCWAKVVPIS